jgi:hypothetical protein
MPVGRAVDNTHHRAFELLQNAGGRFHLRVHNPLGLGNATESTSYAAVRLRIFFHCHHNMPYLDEDEGWVGYSLIFLLLLPMFVVMGFTVKTFCESEGPEVTPAPAYKPVDISSQSSDPTKGEDDEDY